MFLSGSMTPRLEDPADVSVHLENYTLHVECKRPDLSDSIERNLLEAFKWLKKHHTGQGIVGIAAIDVTKALNSSFARVSADTIDECRAHVLGAGNAVARQYQPLAASIYQSDIAFKESVHAVMFRLSVLSTCDIPRPRMEVATDWGIACFGPAHPWQLEFRAISGF
jgi:hypothetical protein